MKHIYLFPGLGADARLFDNSHIEGVEKHVIQYVPPEKDETIQAYCQRLKVQIGHAKPLFLGVSLGGLLAIELAEMLEVEQLFIISSIKSAQEKPLDLRIFKKLPVYRWISADIVKQMAGIASKYFGMHDDQSFQLFKTMLLDTNDDFLTWGMEQVVQWDRPEPPANIVHIQGEYDAIFPPKYLKEPFYLIKGGAHFMAFDKGQEISNLIEKVIQDLVVKEN